MRSRGQLWIGLVLVLVGLLYIIGIVFDINLRGSFWPIVLILLGVWLLVRPIILPDRAGEHFRFFGDVIRRGAWKVENQDFWAFIGDVKLDLSEAALPEGETVIRSRCFIGDMRVIARQDMAIAVSGTAFITDVRLFGEKRDGFIGPFEIATPGYESATRKVRLETLAFLGGLKVRQP
jgi:predicted membrane protein